MQRPLCVCRATCGKEKALSEQGDIVTLHKLHDTLDAAVAAMYGLPPNAQEHEILWHIWERILASVK